MTKLRSFEERQQLLKDAEKAQLNIAGEKFALFVGIIFFGFIGLNSSESEWVLWGIPICAIVWLYSSAATPDANWLSWATVDEYLFENPECNIRHGIACYKCKSSHINSRYWDTSTSDEKKIHSCNACGTKLYVSE